MDLEADFDALDYLFSGGALGRVAFIFVVI
jgi:hypothetical protein